MRTYDWDSITITDNFMFGSVFSNAELARQLLERLLRISILRVEYVNSEQFILPDLGRRGIRMDVYVNDEAGTIYNVEMQTTDEKDLMPRSRYYQRMIDQDCIDPGESFSDMRASFVVFICTFDPFDAGIARYTVTPYCQETGTSMPDGSTRMFLNAMAWDTCDDERLRPFLQYVCGHTMVDDKFTRNVDEKVRALRASARWRGDYRVFNLMLEEQMRKARQKGLEEGRAEGRAEGRVEGLEEGRAEGREQGLEQGREKTLALTARLAQALTVAGRLDELPQALQDEELLANLLDEFALTTE